MDILIQVTNVSFETPYTGVLADPLQNSAQSTQSLVEVIQTVLEVEVTWLNLEVPVSLSIAEMIAVSQVSTQSLYEIIQTPEPEPSPGGGGAAPQMWPRSLVGGKAPFVEEELEHSATSTISIDEVIAYEEEIINHGTATHTITGRYRRRVGEFEFMDVPSRDKTKRIVVSPYKGSVYADELPSGQTIGQRQKEEEELILLGII